jgi:hypothetical protein
MLNQNTSSQSFQAKEFLLGELAQNDSPKQISTYLSKIKSLDVQHVKVYLGLAYFALVSLFSISLFF